jgi:hypothetical protein
MVRDLSQRPVPACQLRVSKDSAALSRTLILGRLAKAGMVLAPDHRGAHRVGRESSGAAADRASGGPAQSQFLAIPELENCSAATPAQAGGAPSRGARRFCSPARADDRSARGFGAGLADRYAPKAATVRNTRVLDDLINIVSEMLITRAAQEIGTT